MVCIRISRGYFGAHHASSCISVLLFDELFLITCRALAGRVLDMARGRRLWPRRPGLRAQIRCGSGPASHAGCICVDFHPSKLSFLFDSSVNRP
jgi:hypothetical protein